ncbi:MAG: hypothetical protein K2P45_04815 [Eubacterium sp.]|nr:hypothetical protein [Eubacterium sp.]
MAERMLIAQALDERDFLVKKIMDKVFKAKLIDTAKRKEEKVLDTRMTKAEFEKEAKATYQQIMDLVRRFEKIDAKIIDSNARAYIETSRGKMSVASAISLRGRIRGDGSYDDLSNFEGNLKEVMEKQYQKCAQIAKENNERLKAASEEFRSSLLNRGCQENHQNPMDEVDQYIDENTMDVIDPLGIIQELDEVLIKRRELLRDLDTQIKISNATTYIEL